MSRRQITQLLSLSIIKRGLMFSLIVGTVLVLINQGDTIYNGQLDTRVVFKIALTYTVPFMVSTVSSIQALQQSESNP